MVNVNILGVLIQLEAWPNDVSRFIQGQNIARMVKHLQCHQEIIQNGSTGYTFEMSNVNDLCDKLNLLLSLNQDEYENFKKNSFEFAKNNFSKEAHFDMLVSLYS
ncbi:hypothetical protein N9Y26_01085 [bacterium]|nr:hypothetical protein [bacterium]